MKFNLPVIKLKSITVGGTMLFCQW